MKCTISSAVLVMCLMVVTCKTSDQPQGKDETQGNHLSDQQMNSLFKIFDRIGNAITRNNTRTEDGSGNNQLIIKNLSLQVSFNFDSKFNSSEKVAKEKCADLTPNIVANISEILERITKLETALQKNEKIEEEEISVTTPNVFEVLNNTDTTPNVPESSNNTDTKKIPEAIPEILELDPCKTASTSGSFKVQSLNQTVYCDMTTFGGGGWLVFQQRIIKEDDSHLNFNQNWAAYRAGFGTVGKDTEFWLGLQALHQLTSSGDYELVVELKDKNGKYGYARYSQFYVAGEDAKYRLTVDGYSGTAGDALSKSNNIAFSTYDKRHYTQCPNYWNGGWWFNTCAHQSAPNFSVGPYWFDFTHTEHTANGIFSRMMIHRK